MSEASHTNAGIPKRPSDEYSDEGRKYSRNLAESDGIRNTKLVAEHYNARPEVGVQKRKESSIFRMKSFNNWVKSVLIGQYAKRGDRVLDMGCGKGGDLLKWSKAKISELVGADVASVSIQQAEQRYQSMRGAKFAASFHAIDCWTESLYKVIPKDKMFDVVSMQFCLHYAFETEAKARMMLQNVSQNLRPGGTFIGTLPDAYWIVKKVKSVEGLSFGNDIYKIEFEQKDTFPTFGHKYWFTLEDAIDNCPEYLVHFPTFEKLAKEYGLELIKKRKFHHLYKDALENEEFTNLLHRMNVVDERESITKEEWEAAGIYLAFAFRKMES
ncbi:guanine-N(7)-methyltransferase [Basidiobolus meristosporus CBS 931.73]|uniref:mRNA cap guanine-N(7) methyltransferase n=1 Tax=Basidiobolus meristosporus CBS 931.73 TaxID=1314790 RepID=A0A1Y1YSJ3_9FUNG|nr:guanine-N(7)-methyltransferase [Basidiobolus meristosporus CBS 931.73]|eukprot:ORY01003.1 guanine-N(7)-methyltransferase [Basidiobolus meristosporus CBS 931.73]